MATYHEIDVTISSAHDLRDVRVFGGRMNPYVAAWIHPDLKAFSPADIKGGTDPKWNAKLLLFCDEELLNHPEDAIVHFEIHDSGSNSDKFVGSATFSLSELPGKHITLKEPSEAVFLNLPVKRASGREQGSLDLSVRIGGVTQQQVIPAQFEDGHFGTTAIPESPIPTGCCGLPHLHQYPQNFDRQDDGNLYAH